MRLCPIRQIDRALIRQGYLEYIEGLLETHHARGVVHLDTRGASNLLMLPDGTPGIIDFLVSR